MSRPFRGYPEGKRLCAMMDESGRIRCSLPPSHIRTYGRGAQKIAINLCNVHKAHLDSADNVAEMAGGA